VRAARGLPGYFAATLALAAGCGGDAPPPADRVFVNGVVYTVDAGRTRAEAVAVRDGRIVHVGSDAEVRRHVGEATEVTDLAGDLLLPGFHDSHIHILVGVATAEDCDLLRLESQDAVPMTPSLQRLFEEGPPPAAIPRGEIGGAAS